MKIKIKNNRKNIFFVIVGKIATFLLIYGISILAFIKVLEFIVNNCITTL